MLELGRGGTFAPFSFSKKDLMYNLLKVEEGSTCPSRFPSVAAGVMKATQQKQISAVVAERRSGLMT